MSPALAALRNRAALLAGLLAVIVVNVGILLSYRAFYDSRLHSLLKEREQLEERREQSRRAAQNVVEGEKHLLDVQGSLDRFFTETLGSRRELLAKVIEEIYAATRRVGMRPDTISYGIQDEKKEEALSFNFVVRGKYADVKKLLADFETSARLLVVDQVSVSADAVDPDVLAVSLKVTHYFKSDVPRAALRAKARSTSRSEKPVAAPRGAGGRK